MMTVILNSAMLDSNTAILDSDTLSSSLRFTQKHSSSAQTLTQTNSIWLTWRWQPSWNSSILNFFHLGFIHLSFPLRLLTVAKIGSHHLHKKNFTHSFWLNLMMAAILNSAGLDSDTLLSSLRFTQKHSHSILTLDSKLIQSDSNSFILTQLDDGSHLEFCHVGFSHLSFSSQTHLHLTRLVPNICTKKLYSFILTQLDDGSYLEICHFWFSHFVQKNFTLSFWLNLMMAAILKSAIMDSAI